MSYVRGGPAASLNLDHALSCREFEHLRSNLEAGIFRQRLHAAENLYQRNLAGHYGCVNALEFNHGGEYLASGGDDKRVLLWHVDQTLANVGQDNPSVMYGEHASNIFCLGFDTDNKYLFSGGNDDLVIQHDLGTGKNLNYFSHDGPVYGLSVDRTSTNMFSVATEHGEILVYDLRVGKNEPLAIAKFRTPFNAVEFHPLNGNFLATANAKRGAQMWDLRHHTQALCQYNYITESPSCMSVRFNCNGSLLLTLHRRLPPILYNPSSSDPLCSFYHDEYFNSCTMKSCTFAGPQDELVVSGSDNFNMFIWRLDGIDLEEKNQWIDTTPVILTGHRSIVNQVRYNRQRCLLASSGVEKIIKFWSPFAQHGWEGALIEPSDTPYCTRMLHRNATDQVSQDFSSRNMDEDQVMLAFFDTLVQRELENWNSNSSSGNGNDNDQETTSGSDSSSGSSTERSESSTQSEEQSEVDTPNVSELSWQTHPNRIFYLVAKKRRALLQLAVKGTGGQHRNVEQLLARLLGEQRQAATQARISEWLEETHRLFGDDELPTTSAEAAARERSRRDIISQPAIRSPRKPPELRMNLNFSVVGSLQASFEQLERKRKLMRLRFAAIKRRRNVRRPRRGRQETDSAMSYDTEWLDDDDDNEPEVNQENTVEENNSNSNSTPDDDTSNTSMEAQLSQAPSTSNSENNNKRRNGIHSEPTTSTVATQTNF
ncbi:DDB1- and CUL4-associated factor 5 isoform X1 [Drosophila novamexicana]|uniref:DDB1- and CUL4-associated factor 5 isoform X1 n=1 Tax=Drosophila novamexicana TaxID=47314 RepID=UPI0011E5A9DF|nr:DDB1- and CUL4-associated factor 5 isoform X1 [Drosophila novamexicana]XP_030573234.1 DDB1- and CUL4-associated factor 5 isoform X1 [Drosophila novamexicana]